VEVVLESTGIWMTLIVMRTLEVILELLLLMEVILELHLLLEVKLELPLQLEAILELLLPLEVIQELLLLLEVILELPLPLEVILEALLLLEVIQELLLQLEVILERPLLLEVILLEAEEEMFHLVSHTTSVQLVEVDFLVDLLHARQMQSPLIQFLELNSALSMLLLLAVHLLVKKSKTQMVILWNLLLTTQAFSKVTPCVLDSHTKCAASWMI